MRNLKKNQYFFQFMVNHFISARNMERAVKAEYDDFSKEYTDSKLSYIASLLRHFFQILGNPENLSFLELGCGDGYYCRELKRSKAANVLGVDICWNSETG